MSQRLPCGPLLGTCDGTATSFCERNYLRLLAVVLGLAALNLAFRLDSEVVTEWDEALYAISAAETLRTGQWVAVTFRGTLDYYNTKPPLNVWLIALAFKTFGINLVSLRLISVLCAWSTVAVVAWWSRRRFGASVSLLAGVVLSTSFGFVYVHAGRSANTDAFFTLLVSLAVLALWGSEHRPWRYAWLGPLLAATFLLRGMAVVMMLALVAAYEIRLGRQRPRAWPPRAIALLLFVIPTFAWAFARWQLDRWQFLERLFDYDFLARSLGVIEGHPGGLLYYARVLVKHQYEWIVAAGIALLLFPPSWPREVRTLSSWRDHRVTTAMIGCWAAITVGIPTLMRTKLPWYMNPFYPVFAIVIAGVLAQGLCEADPERPSRWRRIALGLAVLSAFCIAEGKLQWYSVRYRPVGRSVQGLMISQRHRLKGRRVYRDKWDHAEFFVVRDVAAADPRVAADVWQFLSVSRPSDYWVCPLPIADARLGFIASNGQQWLYERHQ
jgi:4-amino-4-deoxy-L-arabinose transferase-like glycosyltransferase